MHAADALQGMPLLQTLRLQGNSTRELAAYRVAELLRVVPTLVEVELSMKNASAAAAQSVLDALDSDPLRCLGLRKACRQCIHTWEAEARTIRQVLA